MHISGVCISCGRGIVKEDRDLRHNKCSICRAATTDHEISVARYARVKDADAPAVRPICDCRHYVSLHIENGCVLCTCSIIGTGELERSIPVMIPLPFQRSVQVG